MSGVLNLLIMLATMAGFDSATSPALSVVVYRKSGAISSDGSKALE
jgi:hypothetical protein